MRKIPAGQFKAHCLSIMDEVRIRRETVVITKRGREVARLVPPEVDDDPIFGFLQGQGRVTGDLVAPIVEDWGSLDARD